MFRKLWRRIFRKIYHLHTYGDARVVEYKYNTTIYVNEKGVQKGPYKINKGDIVIVSMESEIIEELRQGKGKR